MKKIINNLQIMSNHVIDISSNSPLWDMRDLTYIRKTVEETVKLAINEGLSYLDKGNINTEISILLSDNDFIQELNKTYRDKDKPTNVLSFPQTEVEEFDCALQNISLGDIIISYSVIEAEALEQKKDFFDHFRHMLVHGTLHLMHFDHIYDEEAEEMEGLEIEILSKMNIKNPYEIQ